MAPSKLSVFPLPIELLCEIIKFLPLKDLQTLSLASRLIRSQAIRFIFGHLRYTGNILHRVRNIHQARKDVKEAIKKFELSSDLSDYIIFEEDEEDNRPVIFQFLETLPNLQVLNIGEYVPPWPAYLYEFISSIRHTALLELVLHAGYAFVEGPPTAGLAGLEKLSIFWNAGDDQDEPGSSLAHLYELIRPALTTLVELRIDMIDPDDLVGDFDLELLKPAADTLRTFEYTLLSADESILDIIPAILPHLTNLIIIREYFIRKHSILWKDAHIRALSKFKNITGLTLPSDFEVNAQDTGKAHNDYAWIVRCYKRRLKATQDIALACPRLQRCSWVQMGLTGKIDIRTNILTHSFIVEERMTGGNVTRVVRGIKQHWMGRDHDTRGRGGGIVKCKLEDLPGEIIGQNDVE